VTGTPSQARHGFLTTTVSGTGTPGDHIVVYADHGAAAETYFPALYPQFADQTGAPVSGPVQVDASLLPPDDGTVVVDATGAWSTTLTRKPGTYVYTAFAVDPATVKYSLAGNVVFVNLLGTPIVDPAAVSTPTELAFTGSQTPWTALIGAVGALVAGASLLVVAARRRRTE
jgi:LPXTG-motif cell wall-anchored protein